MKVVIELDLETDFSKEELAEPETRRAIQESVYAYLTELIEDESLNFTIVGDEDGD